MDQQKDSSSDLKQMMRTSRSLKKLIVWSKGCFSNWMAKDYFTSFSTETRGELNFCSKIVKTNRGVADILEHRLKLCGTGDGSAYFFKKITSP